MGIDYDLGLVCTELDAYRVYLAVDLRGGNGMQVSEVLADLPSYAEAEAFVERLREDKRSLVAGYGLGLPSRESTMGRQPCFIKSTLDISWAGRECGCHFASDMLGKEWKLVETSHHSSQRRRLASGISFADAIELAMHHGRTTPGECSTHFPERFRRDASLDHDCFEEVYTSEDSHESFEAMRQYRNAMFRRLTSG